MTRLRARDARAADDWSGQLGRLQSDLEADMDHWRAEDAKLPPTTGDGGYSSERNTVRGNMNSIGRCLGVVRDEREFVQSAAFKSCSTHYCWSAASGARARRTCCVTSRRCGSREAKPPSWSWPRTSTGVSSPRFAVASKPGAVKARFSTNFRRWPTSEGACGRHRGWRQRRTSAGVARSCKHPSNPRCIAPKCRVDRHVPDTVRGNCDRSERLGQVPQVTHFGFDDQEFDAQACLLRVLQPSAARGAAA
jgi:hypothetical protein